MKDVAQDVDIFLYPAKSKRYTIWLSGQRFYIVANHLSDRYFYQDQQITLYVPDL
jgi:hypothetical protein